MEAIKSTQFSADAVWLLHTGTLWVLIKTRNDLERPETTYNEQEAIRNDLQQPENTYNEQETTYNEQEMTWNDPQGAKDNLKRHKLTYNEVKKKRNDQQQADFEIILQHTAIGSLLWYVFHPKFACNHSSIASWRIMVKTERKTIVYYHVYLLTGYKIYRIRCEPLWYSKINIYETKVNLMN